MIISTATMTALVSLLFIHFPGKAASSALEPAVARDLADQVAARIERRYRPRRRRIGERAVVRVDLEGVIVAVAAIGVLVAGERRRMALALARRRQDVEIAAGIAAAHQRRQHPHVAGDPAMRR